MPSGDIDDLVANFARLPGLGPRSARRVVLRLVRHPRRFLDPLIALLSAVRDAIRICATCGNVDTRDPCAICADPRRDRSVICVVEDVGDLWALERAGATDGVYHVLGGALSALDGIGPDDIGMAALQTRAGDTRVEEVILATNATVEGQTTAHCITDMLRAAPHVRVTRLAHGVPLGGELDYLDDGTLLAAVRARREH